MEPLPASGLEDELVAWGALERAGDGYAWTRRFRGFVMREAARLAGEERAGRAPAGGALANAVVGALEAFPHPDGAAYGELHARRLVEIELAALPEELRRALGA
ncbi:MAG TPA: hypothetical protein VM889_00815 [Candidatus Thermoplasmatota archaeon]|nr:hypothetical protein [Candidatus Thermoplasmatota archaeon]